MFSSAVVIDDDVDLCLLVKAILYPSVSKITCVHSLEVGKNILNETNPDLIFLDNNLPDGQGIDLIREIKAARPRAIVIMISALDNIKQKALDEGADLFIEKPLSHKVLKEVIHTLAVN